MTDLEETRPGTLVVHGHQLPLPVDIRDTRLTLVATVSLDEPIMLPPGLYAISVPVPGRPEFPAVVDLQPGGQQSLDVPVNDLDLHAITQSAPGDLAEPSQKDRVLSAAATLVEQGQFDAALHLLTNAPELPPIGVVLLGFTALQVNDLDRAAQAVERIVDPGPDGLALRAAVLRERGADDDGARRESARLVNQALDLGLPQLTAAAHAIVTVIRDNNLPPTIQSRALISLVRNTDAGRTLLTPDQAPAPAASLAQPKDRVARALSATRPTGAPTRRGTGVRQRRRAWRRVLSGSGIAERLLTTVDRNQQATIFVIATLVAALIGGVVLLNAYSGHIETASLLLISCVLVAFGFVGAAAKTTSRYRRSQILAEKFQVPPARTLHLLKLRQWLVLLLGLSSIAIWTGALTGVQIAALTESPSLPSVVPTTQEPATPGQTETVEPTYGDTPGPGSTDATPGPDTTKYLSSENANSGSYDVGSVMLSGTRYPRSISFRCSDITDSVLQWNVTGATSFRGTAGIDDDTVGAFGAVVEFLFYDQDGRQLVARPIEVSLGNPKRIQLDLSGVVSLRMTCASRDAATNQQRFTIAVLGDPVVVLD